jgi:hypothetical protein
LAIPAITPLVALIPLDTFCRAAWSPFPNLFETFPAIVPKFSTDLEIALPACTPAAFAAALTSAMSLLILATACSVSASRASWAAAMLV